jgi:hypothetical protein
VDIAYPSSEHTTTRIQSSQLAKNVHVVSFFCIDLYPELETMYNPIRDPGEKSIAQYRCCPLSVQRYFL